MCEMAIFKEKEARRSQGKVRSMEQTSLELMRVSRNDAETSVTARAAVSGREKNEVTRGRGRTLRGQRGKMNSRRGQTTFDGHLYCENNNQHNSHFMPSESKCPSCLMVTFRRDEAVEP